MGWDPDAGVAGRLPTTCNWSHPATYDAPGPRPSRPTGEPRRAGTPASRPRPRRYPAGGVIGRGRRRDAGRRPNPVGHPADQIHLPCPKQADLESASRHARNQRRRLASSPVTIRAACWNSTWRSRIRPTSTWPTPAAAARAAAREPAQRRPGHGHRARDAERHAARGLTLTAAPGSVGRRASPTGSMGCGPPGSSRTSSRTPRAPCRRAPTRAVGHAARRARGSHDASGDGRHRDPDPRHRGRRGPGRPSTSWVRPPATCR